MRWRINLTQFKKKIYFLIVKINVDEFEKKSEFKSKLILNLKKNNSPGRKSYKVKDSNLQIFSQFSVVYYNL